MSEAYYPIPGYKGSLTIGEVGSDRADGVIIPIERYKWHGSLTIDLSYSACGAPYPDVYPGLMTPGVMECWGPFRTDFNPFTSAPILQPGQNIATWWGIYTPSSGTTIVSYVPQTIVVTFEYDDDTNSQGVYHLAFASVWEWESIDPGTLVRGIGTDNYEGDTGYDD